MLQANNGTTISLETWITLDLIARNAISPQKAMELAGSLPEEDQAFFTRVMQAVINKDLGELDAIADELKGDPR